MSHMRLSDEYLPADYISRFSRARSPTLEKHTSNHLQPILRDLNHFTRDGMEVIDSSPWSDIRTSLRYSQSIPDDITKSDENDSIWDDGASLTDIFDRTSLDTDFDYSCLDTLDDQLLLHPRDSFTDVCWEEAVYDDSDRVATPTGWSTSSSVTRPDQQRVQFDAPSDDDSDECRTSEDDDYIPTTYIYGERDTSEQYPSDYILPIMKEKPTSFDRPLGDAPSSFIFLDPHFSTSGPSESVGFFPTTSPATRQRINFRKGVTTFCSNLPSRLVKSAT